MTDVRQKEQLRNYIIPLVIENFDQPLCVTLSEKQQIVRTDTSNFRKNQFIQYVERIDDIKSSTNLRHCLNRLNSKIYRNAFDRHKSKRLFVLPVRESDAQKRHHLHLLVNRPPHICENDFRELFFMCWHQTPFAYENNQIAPPYKSKEQYAEYMLKFRTKKNLLDAVDIENLYLQTPPT